MKNPILCLLVLAAFAKGLPLDDQSWEPELMEIEYVSPKRSSDFLGADGEWPLAEIAMKEGFEESTLNRENTADCPKLYCYQDCLIPDVDTRGCLRSCNCKKSGLWGDIMLSENDVAMLESNAVNRAGSTFARRWDQIGLIPSKGRVYMIFYTLDRYYEKNKRGKMAIYSAAKELYDKTCIVFQRKPTSYNSNYVFFRKGETCSSPVGKQGKDGKLKQEITLSAGCESKGYVLHEMMHTLGFWHEHMRPDRDDYVKIKWENIEQDKKSQFEIKTAAETNYFGSAYDVGSVTHYDGKQFSKNGQPTIYNKKTWKPVIAQRNGLSEQDVAQINAMYECDKL